MSHPGTPKKFFRFIQTPIFSMRLDATGESGLLENIEGEISKNPKGGTLLKGGVSEKSGWLPVCGPREKAVGFGFGTFTMSPIRYTCFS
jgi:hypothetical protein